MIASVGLCVTDLTLAVDHLPTPGESVNSGRVWQSEGGKAANQLVSAARLGARTALVGTVGSPVNGWSPLDSLRREGIDLSGVEVVDETAGYSVILLTPAAEQVIVTHPGPGERIRLEVATEALNRLHPSLLLLQGEITTETTLRLGRGFGGMVVLDPSPAGEFTGQDLSFASVLTPNVGEARRLTGLTEPSAKDVAEATGARAVALTCGADGVKWYLNGESGHLTPPPVTVVDPTGAGDAFNGALAASMDRGVPFPDAVQLAVHVSALSVQTMHCIPSYPTIEQVTTAFPAVLAHEEAQ